MTNTTLNRPKQAELPPFIVMACCISPEQETHSVMVLNDEGQHLLEAFSCSDIRESIQIQTAMEKRHGDINYIVICPQIMLNMFSALALSEDGQIFHKDAFESAHLEPISFEQVNFHTIDNHPVLSLIHQKDVALTKLDDIKGMATAYQNLVTENGDKLTPRDVSNFLWNIISRIDN